MLGLPDYGNCSASVIRDSAKADVWRQAPSDGSSGSICAQSLEPLDDIAQTPPIVRWLPGSSFQQGNRMKNLRVITVGMPLLLANSVSLAQSGHMMNGGSWGGHWMGGWMGGYGGAWLPILLIVVLVALVAWVVTKNKK